ncbi:hypothetical protein [Myxosarcina sp. GI1]|uniref:hypothetical protein n=1 Tax=Myxosarcina sp. GI1 TaxID=1541065 RepID=UPI00055CAAE3|nr:hypothetical protein [Myxosarcina sp. GI1]
MLAISIVTLSVAAISIYLSSIIEDDVFKAGMRFTALTFSLITLFCAPWILKLGLVIIPLILGSFNSLSLE